VAVVLAFGDRTMLDQDAQRPTPKAAIGRPGENWRYCFALGGAFMTNLESIRPLIYSIGVDRPESRLAYACCPWTEPCDALDRLVKTTGRSTMAKKQTTRGRKQDRALVAGGQDYEVRYEGKKTQKSASAVKRAVKKVGNSRNRVERRLAR
jgi:hypothetical protein